MIASIQIRFFFIFVLFTFDVLELPYARRDDEVKLRSIIRQGREDEDKAQFFIVLLTLYY